MRIISSLSFIHSTLCESIFGFARRSLHRAHTCMHPKIRPKTARRQPPRTWPKCGMVIDFSTASLSFYFSRVVRGKFSCVFQLNCLLFSEKKFSTPKLSQASLSHFFHRLSNLFSPIDFLWMEQKEANVLGWKIWMSFSSCKQKICLLTLISLEKMFLAVNFSSRRKSRQIYIQ